MEVLFNTVIFLTSFLFVLSALVFFHELGHYSVARFFKVAVERFSIGFGKPLYRWTSKKTGVQWMICRIPLGGYVKFLGDAGAGSNPDRDKLDMIKAELAAQDGVSVEDCFHFKPLWQRFLVVLAGPVANFILAATIFAVIAMWVGTQDVRSVVTGVLTGSAADAADIRIGDRFVTLSGQNVELGNDFISLVALSSGRELIAEIERDGEILTLPVTPRRQLREDFIGGKNNIGTMGVFIGGEENFVSTRYSPLQAGLYGFGQVYETIALTGLYVKRIFTGKEDGKALGGVARIATMTGKVAVDTANLEISWSQRVKTMVLRLLSLAAALSVGLGVANLMPIPVLDGGHLLYYGYEALSGRPLSEKAQEFGFKMGFTLLLLLMVILTWNDIGYIRSIFS